MMDGRRTDGHQQMVGDRNSLLSTLCSGELKTHNLGNPQMVGMKQQY